MLAKIGHKVSEATRKKIRDKLKGRKISDEARKHRIGRKLSPEHRRSIGLASKGRKHSEATKRKMRGRKHSEATKRKLSEARKGAKNPMYGKNLSEEHKKKIGRKGKLNKNYGKKLSEQHRRNIGLAQKGKKYAPGRVAAMKGRKHSEETKRKMSVAQKGRKHTPMSNATKRKLSSALKGRSSAFKGKRHTTESRRKMSQAAKGKKRAPFSIETKRKMSEARKGIKHSEETKSRQSTAKKKLYASGFVNPWKGKKHSEKSRKLMSLALKGKKYAPGRIHPFKGKKLGDEHKKKIGAGLKGHPTSEKTRRMIGASNKISAKRFWNTLTEKEKAERTTKPGFFKKGQTSWMKGKKASAATRERNRRSQILRFQTQRHPHQGTHRSEKTKQLLREARIRQKPFQRETWPEKLVSKMLKGENIRFEKQKGFRNPYCITDFYVEPKICIFVDGDYWHCNPKDYVYKKKLNSGFKANDQISGKKYAKDVWAKDKKITRELTKKGFTVIRFWQNELETDKEKCLEKILKAIKT